MFFNSAISKLLIRKEKSAKDLDTLFIVAGCPGAGKSTVIKSAYILDIPIFGNDFHEKFLTTCRSPGFEEYEKYTDAKKYGSIFQARHLINLKKDPSPPDSLLLHVDLKGVVKTLGHATADQDKQKQIKRKLNLPNTENKIIDPNTCDLMIEAFLGNHFFKRFKYVLINTVLTDVERSSAQLAKRKFRGKNKKKLRNKWKHLGFSSAKLAQQFHKEVHKSWERNLHILKPEKIQFTSLSKNGDIMINNAQMPKE